MNRLSILLPALSLALALALPGTASTREPVAGGTPTAKEKTPAPKEKDKFQINYYWYTYPADTYNDYENLTVEELEWWIYLLVPIDTSPTGGTLIARGYLTDAYPHTMYASEYLYAHY
jgi:hypothetical protein